MTLRPDLRWAIAGVLTLALFVAPALADLTAGQKLVAEAEAALDRRDGNVGQLKLDEAVRAGVPQGKIRHLLAHAAFLKGDIAKARELAAPAAIAPRFAAYAARIRAATAPSPPIALAELESAVKLAPGDPRGWTDLARQRFFVGDLAKAFAAAERAVALDPGNTDMLVLAGNLTRTRYGGEAALQWYERAIAVDPRNPAALLERAATLGDLGREPEAGQAIAAMLDAWGDNPGALYLHAVRAARGGDWVGARGWLYRVGGRLGDLPGQRLLAGTIELAQGNADQALIELRSLVARQPANKVARRLLGQAYFEGGDMGATIATLAPIAQRADADVYTLTLTGRAYEALGDRSAAARWLDRASAPLVGASTSYPDRPGGGDTNSAAPGPIVFAGDVLAERGRWREAAEAYRKAANLDFSESTALRLLDALKRSGQALAALEVLATLRAARPLSLAAGQLGAEVELANQRWVQAEATLTALRQRVGDRDATLLNNLAWAKSGQGKRAQAVTLGRAAYALAPNNPPVVASYGWFAHLNGDKATAVALLEKAVALAPDVPQFRERLAKARAGR